MSRINGFNKASLPKMDFKNPDEVMDDQRLLFKQTLNGNEKACKDVLHALEEGRTQEVKGLVGDIIGNNDVFAKLAVADIIHIFEPPSPPCDNCDKCKWA